jgi:glycosyltransferase involved in cell wall biosynthesis
LLQNCLFLAYPSFYEGFGFPILEAQRHSKIVLTSRVSSMPEIGKDACLYINPFDYKDIANGFLILTKDPVFAQSLTDNIPKNANSYGWEELQNGLEKILKSSI